MAARIIGVPGPWLAARSRSSTQVEVQVPEGASVFGYAEMMAAHLDARVIAIPLDDNQVSLAGLTSLVDARAIGRPVVITRNRLIDLDVEAEGIGRWVAHEYIGGWAEALRWFEQNPEASQAIRRRARALADGPDGNRRLSPGTSTAAAGVVVREHTGISLLNHALHGPIKATPHCSRSIVFRVASLAPARRAMAAICASNCAIGRP